MLPDSDEEIPQAGPSRHRPTQNGGTHAQRGPRHSEMSQSTRMRLNIEDVFERQPRETKARLGREYREMQIMADDMKANSANTTLEQLKKSIKHQAKLFSEVKDTSLATADARLMNTTADTALEIARKMRLEGNLFDTSDFLLRMSSLLGLDRQELDEQDPEDEDELDESMSDRGRGGAGRRRPFRKGHLGDWEKIGWMAAGLSRRVTGLEVLYGPLKVPRRAPVQRQRREKVVEPETRPQEISTQTRSANGEQAADTVGLVKQVQAVLEKSDPHGQGVNFFKLVIDPDDFGQSVENCFYLSFLIKEGKAGIDVMDDGEVMIYSKNGADPDIDGDITTHQAVIELDMDTWEEAKSLFDITKGTIPHRQYAEQGPLAAGAWYT
ncbi:Nse4 C-terminal-domain-containing protein [Kockovaella imperatae]|uniref:Non-structural maintenance of chromosomes element 4 n=1 Tax=Kockovaella imperatae TaxID=4999 RepID=A0A1Y1UJ19_9TREE|nr:Nse4 C-terminal-domain-containing protein [Kockovaella imperatae]ORX38058.1 Nse4 C-terminal-domain-containing protein [Kockovaella imperatae]